MTDAEKRALADMLNELVSVLCYQVDIPLQHKQDLVEAQLRLQRLMGVPEVTGTNGQ